MQREACIPKKIHYIWLGKGEKSDLIKSCMKKTENIMDDWEIIEWNEESLDINNCEYAKEAYEQGKYAFAADYARFVILYKYGGIYLDTDVELLKRIPDEFFEDIGFTGVEANMKIASGLVFAVEPKNPVVKEILDTYEKEKFILEDGSVNKKTVVDIVTEVFSRHGFKRDGEEQIVDGFHIYPCEYFCAYDFVTREFSITEKTISIHHYTATWTGRGSRTKIKIQSALRKTVGINNYKRIIKIKRKLFGVHGE